MRRYDLVSAAQEDRLSYSWADVVSAAHGYTLTARMTADAVRVDGVRGTVTAAEAQAVADQLGCVLPTARLLDLRHQQADIKLDPHTMPGCPTSDAAVRRHSALIDGDVAGAGHGTVSPTGKHWVLDERMTPGRAVLYGWAVPYARWSHGRMRWRGIPVHSAVTEGCGHVLQPVSTAHDYHHHDYSMMLVLCHERALLSYQDEPASPVMLADVYRTPRLCELVLHTPRPIPARYPIG